MADDYTDDEVREAFQQGAGILPPFYDKGYEYELQKRGDAFDRWLAEHDRQVAESAWDEGHLVHGEHYRHNGYCRDSGGCIAVNPYRKEQEESKK